MSALYDLCMHTQLTHVLYAVLHDIADLCAGHIR